MRIAESDSAMALAQARNVSEAWFRSQALAEVARYAPDENVAQIAEEAIAAALVATDIYKQVAVTAWAFRALLERNQQKKATELLPTILSLSTQIENPVSRSDALFLLWQAFFPFNGHRSVLGALVKSCNGHWKADYILRQIVLILATENQEDARKLAVSMREGKYKRQAEKRLSQGQTQQAHQFFHQSQRPRLPDQNKK